MGVSPLILPRSGTPGFVPLRRRNADDQNLSTGLLTEKFREPTLR
jgi:hypothetical protein